MSWAKKPHQYQANSFYHFSTYFEIDLIVLIREYVNL